MENKTIWRIRHKESQTFLGGAKSRWGTKPTQFLAHNPVQNPNDWEYVKYIYELKEVTTEEIKL